MTDLVCWVLGIFFFFFWVKLCVRAAATVQGRTGGTWQKPSQRRLCLSRCPCLLCVLAAQFRAHFSRQAGQAAHSCCSRAVIGLVCRHRSYAREILVYVCLWKHARACGQPVNRSTCSVFIYFFCCCFGLFYKELSREKDSGTIGFIHDDVHVFSMCVCVYIYVYMHICLLVCTHGLCSKWGKPQKPLTCIWYNVCFYMCV